MFWFVKRLRAWTPEQLNNIVKFPDSAEAKRRISNISSLSKNIIAFYTKDAIYEREAARMAASAARLGLNVTTTPCDGTGSWVRNASMKPTFLLEQRKRLRGPLLYVDVDAVFHNDPWPELADHDGDISVYYTAPDAKYNGRSVLVSATILINDTPAAKRLLEVWKAACDANPDVLDQQVLQEILERDQDSQHPEFSVRLLPESLCWIFDRKGAALEIVHIEQLQASRATTNRRFFAKKKLRRRRQRIRQIEDVLNTEATQTGVASTVSSLHPAESR